MMPKIIVSKEVKKMLGGFTKSFTKPPRPEEPNITVEMPITIKAGTNCGEIIIP